MTRMTIANLIADFNTKYQDNSSGMITPALARASFANQMDSAVPMIGNTGGSAASPGVAVNLTTAPIKLPGTFFSEFLSGNPTFFEGRPSPNGDLISHTNIGRLHLNFDVTFTAGTGVDIAFTIGQNGVPVVFRTIVSGQGNANPVSGTFSRFISSVAPNDVFDIRASVLTGTTTIQLLEASIKGILFPQFA